MQIFTHLKTLVGKYFLTDGWLNWIKKSCCNIHIYLFGIWTSTSIKYEIHKSQHTHSNMRSYIKFKLQWYGWRTPREATWTDEPLPHLLGSSEMVAFPSSSPWFFACTAKQNNIDFRKLTRYYRSNLIFCEQNLNLKQLKCEPVCFLRKPLDGSPCAAGSADQQCNWLLFAPQSVPSMARRDIQQVSCAARGRTSF